jgi:N-acetylmuramoyl-L-alanine amidase
MTKTVVLGYGHGSNTWETGGGKGVRKNGKVYEEHTANVQLGEKIVKILKAHGVRVILTQPAMGKDVSLNSRLAIVKKHDPDVWIEVHHNAGVASASGSCVFAWKTGAPKSNKLQDEIVSAFKSAGIETHGSGQHDSTLNSWTNLFVTRNSQYLRGAVVLTENGFMTNSGDFEDIFGSNREKASTQKAIATAKGILSYLGIEYDSGETQEAVSTYYSAKTNSTDPKVKDIQKKLLALGFKLPEYGADGDFGGETEKAVIAFQEKYKLTVDGIAGEETLSKLEELYQKKQQPKEPKKKVYRVIVDGEQVGAYAEDSNILDQIKKAMPHLKENITIEEV